MKVGGQNGLAHFGEVGGIAAVVAADDEEEVHLFDAEHFGKGILPFLGGAANGVGLAEMFVEVLMAVTVAHGLLETALHFLRFVFHHGGLVGHADGDEVLVGIEAGGVGALELAEEFAFVTSLADVIADVIGLGEGEDDEVMRARRFR